MSDEMPEPGSAWDMGDDRIVLVEHVGPLVIEGRMWPRDRPDQDTEVRVPKVLWSTVEKTEITANEIRE